MNLNRCLLMNNNIEIPQLALGTYKIEDDEIANVIEKAIEIGYRHIDCAYIYGNEKSIGKALTNLFDQEKIKRSDLFLTSKLWCSFHKYQRVKQQCSISIDNLQCQYLDLFLIHWPISFIDQDPSKSTDQLELTVDNDIDLTETWKAMESLVDQGLVKSIGLSNFNEKQIENILQICKYKPVVNQVEIHPFCPQIELETFCKKHQVLLQAFAPLGAKGRHHKQINDPELLDDQTIKSIANKYHVDPSSVLIRYIIDRNLICIIKSSNYQRLKQNYLLSRQNQFHLNDEDFHLIRQQIQTRFRYYLMTDGIQSKQHPFPLWNNFIPN